MHKHDLTSFDPPLPCQQRLKSVHIGLLAMASQPQMRALECELSDCDSSDPIPPANLRDAELE